MAAEAAEQAAGSGSSSRSGNVFTRHYGPLPGWGWAALAGGAALVYFYWRQRKAATSTAATTAATTAAYGTTNTSTYDTEASLAALQSEIQQLQGAQATPAATAVTTAKTTAATTAKTTAATTGKTNWQSWNGGGSSGPTPSPVTVPKVTGLSTPSAIAKLASSGMRAGVNGSASSGKIISQTPGAGSLIHYGAAYWPQNQSPIVDLESSVGPYKGNVSV